jgi:hypothetical protein
MTLRKLPFSIRIAPLAIHSQMYLVSSGNFVSEGELRLPGKNV